MKRIIQWSVLLLCIVSVFGCRTFSFRGSLANPELKEFEDKIAGNLIKKYFPDNGKGEIGNYNKYLESKGYSYLFYEEEFGKPPLKADDLYNAVKAKGYDISFKDTGNALYNLNKLLEIPKFYDALCQKENKKKNDFCEDVRNLAADTQKYSKKDYSKLSEEEKYNIRRLNHLLLEETFPKECPKSESYKFSFLEEAKQRRNGILNDLIVLVNIRFAQYERGIYHANATISTAADIAVLGVTAAGTLAGGNDTKAILSAIAAGLTGSRIAYEKNFLFEYAAPVLIARMHCLREAKLVEINKKMVEKGIREYSLEQGFIDIQEYFYSATMIGALQDINKNNVTPTDSFEEAKKYIERIKDINRLLGTGTPTSQNEGKK